MPPTTPPAMAAGAVVAYTAVADTAVGGDVGVLELLLEDDNTLEVGLDWELVNVVVTALSL